jgi:excisionase family DNA binding protein
MEERTDRGAQPLLLTIPQVAASLGLCRAEVYKLIATAGLPTIHFGRAIRVSTTSLQKWVEAREAQEQTAK